MNHILVSSPLPACILTTHPARAYIDPSDTDVAKTWAQHTPIQYADDYDMNERSSHLDMAGEFAK